MSYFPIRLSIKLHGSANWLRKKICVYSQNSSILRIQWKNNLSLTNIYGKHPIHSLCIMVSSETQNTRTIDIWFHMISDHLNFHFSSFFIKLNFYLRITLFLQFFIFKHLDSDWFAIWFMFIFLSIRTILYKKLQKFTWKNP